MSDLILAPLVKTVQYDPETRDFAMFLDGDLVGYARTAREAEDTLNELVYSLLTEERRRHEAAELALEERAAVADSAADLAEEPVYCERCGLQLAPADALLVGDEMVCERCADAARDARLAREMDALDAAQGRFEEAAHAETIERFGHDPNAWGALPAHEVERLRVWALIETYRASGPDGRRALDAALARIGFTAVNNGFGQFDAWRVAPGVVTVSLPGGRAA